MLSVITININGKSTLRKKDLGLGENTENWSIGHLRKHSKNIKPQVKVRVRKRQCHSSIAHTPSLWRYCFNVWRSKFLMCKTFLETKRITINKSFKLSGRYNIISLSTSNSFEICKTNVHIINRDWQAHIIVRDFLTDLFQQMLSNLNNINCYKLNISVA